MTPRIRRFLQLALSAFAIHLGLGSGMVTAQDENKSPPASLTTVKDHVDAAAKHYKAKELEESATEINSAMADIQVLLSRKMTKNSFDDLKKTYARLKKAHQLLKEKGATLDDLVKLPAMPPTGKKGNDSKGGAGSISFTKQIAPLLAQNCGMCHVQGSKGQVHFTSFEELMNSPKGLINPKDPEHSRLYQSIQSKKMPPRRPMNEADIKLVEDWIRSGAEFDGKDKSARLTNR